LGAVVVFVPETLKLKDMYYIGPGSSRSWLFTGGAAVLALPLPGRASVIGPNDALALLTCPNVNTKARRRDPRRRRSDG
jgi:hypothetical protein